jgi:hypothetical protein
MAATSLLTLYLFVAHLSADSLEEVVGLDVGYTGGALHKRLYGKTEEDKNYSAYLDEYADRRKERAYLKNTSGHSGLPASSVHSISLHGSSYHGRKVITPAMREEALSNNSGSLKSPESDQEWKDNEKAVMDSSRNSGQSLSSVKE